MGTGEWEARSGETIMLPRALVMGSHLWITNRQ